MSRVLALLLVFGAACETSPEPPPSEPEGTTSGPDSSSDVGLEASSTESSQPSAPIRLADPAAWRLVPADEDPYDDRPEMIDCSGGYGEEDEVFEFDSGVCSYGTFAQPSLAAIAVGDTVELVLVHDPLQPEDGEDSAVAHVALEADGVLMVELSIDIPSDALLHRPTWIADVDVPAGTRLHFHIHNHGLNSYRLVSLETSSPES